MRLLNTILGAALLCAIPRVALCASVGGTVSDTHGNPVGGVEISAQNSAGKAFGKARSDLHGHYEITGLMPDAYQFVLTPLATGFRGGSGVSHLGTEATTIDWKVSADASALAMAGPGAPDQIAGDPFGYTAGQFAALVAGATGVVAGGVVGGYAAAGGFGGGNSNGNTPIVSSSR